MTFERIPLFLGRSTHDPVGRADHSEVKLFRRNDDAYAADATQRNSASTQSSRSVSRLNVACAQMREVHTELDGIESRLTTLRERQAAFLTRAAAVRKPTPEQAGRVETVDLRSLADVDLTSAQLDDVASDAPEGDDFDERFAAFAAGENDDMSRRWLDNA